MVNPSSADETVFSFFVFFSEDSFCLVFFKETDVMIDVAAAAKIIPVNVNLIN